MQQIGRYQILDTLGQGAMATVYRAYDPKIDRTLAIKVLRPERCIDEEYRTRFLREAKAVGLLSHPNIVTVYDVGEIEDTPYIAMELLNGQPLNELMKEHGQFDVKDVLQMGTQLATALAYAHEKGIIHRDIKPSNIIIDQDSGTAKITDFGIARMETVEVTQQTQMGEVLGTPQYMSPEQVMGQQADARSDLFSVGVILYQLLSGKRPFAAETLATLLLQIATEEPEPIGNLAPDLPGALKQVVDKLLKKQPEKRFQTGTELAHALKRVHSDIEEREEAKSQPRIIPIQIKWSLIMAAAVSVTMILVGSYLYQKQYVAMRDQVLNYGSALVKFVAGESAEAVLSEDWASIELFVQDAIQRQDFEYLVIVDHNGIIRGSNRSDQIDQSYKAPENDTPLTNVPGVSISEHTSSEKPVLRFETPILFTDKEIGRAHLGLPKEPLETVANQMVVMLGVLMLMTIVAVVVVAFIMGKLIASPLSTLNKAMKEISSGQFSYRIAQNRRDEIGVLFNSFDNMAEELQDRDEHRATQNRDAA
ncbi:MAG: protein kinase [Gammaproteobacteria bacterium]|nr:protein kinase [Gammaproteobacteria bacterium]